MAAVDTATSVLGQPVILPLLGAPVRLTGLLHPAGGPRWPGRCARLARSPCWPRWHPARSRKWPPRPAGMPVLVLTVDVPGRPGADIVKAVALGARACLAGRPLAYGPGAGEAGARRAAEILRAELRTALTLAGCPSVYAIDASWVAGDSRQGIRETADERAG